jgi:hypothetical protein
VTTSDRGRAPAGAVPSRGLGIALPAAFFVLSLVGVLHHEMWRDEYQAWMVAQQSHSLPELFRNLRYEGNPALWHLVLFGVTRVFDAPIAMALVHVGISTAAIVVLARHVSLPAVVKVLFAFGYAAFFEFNLVSRGYALGVLLLLTFCALFPRRDYWLPVAALVLGALANTNPFGLVLAGFLGAHLLLEHIVRFRESTSWTRVALAATILLAGCAASALQIVAEPDNTFPVEYVRRWRGDRALLALSRILTAYIPIPPLWTEHFWNRSVFDAIPRAAQASVSVAMVSVFAAAFLRRPLVALLYVTGTSAMVAFFYATTMTYQRYCLHLLVLLVTCFALAPHHLDEAPPRLRPLAAWAQPWASRLFLVVLTGGAVGGIGTYLVDLVRPFSTSQRAAELLRSAGLAHLEIVGHSDFAVSPLAAILGKPIYYPDRRDYGRFVIWDGRRKEATPRDVAAALEGMLQRGEARFLWIAAEEKAYRDVASRATSPRHPLLGRARIELVGVVPPGVVEDERYFIHLVEQRPPALE